MSRRPGLASIRAAVLLGGVLASPWLAHAQTGPLSSQAQVLQAKSQEEFDAYLQVVAANDPHTTLSLVHGFVSAYPASDLIGLVYQSEMHAFETLGDLYGELAAGRRALAALPDNLNTLLTLAPAIINHVSGGSHQDELVLEAEQYARRALAAIDKTRPPHEVALDAWDTQKRDMQSRCHEVLGVVAIHRQQPSVAIDEFQTALRLTQTPQGSQLLRLGIADKLAGRQADAEAAFRRAAELGPAQVRTLAEQQMRTSSPPRALP